MIDLNTPSTITLPPVTLSGTNVDFFNVPPQCTGIDIEVSSLSTNGGAQPIIRIGNGSFIATGYGSSCATVGTTTSGNNYALAFLLMPNTSAPNLSSGRILLRKVTGNTWSLSSQLSFDGQSFICISAGTLALSGVLDRFQLSTTGVDTFDSGTILVKYRFD